MEMQSDKQGCQRYVMMSCENYAFFRWYHFNDNLREMESRKCSNT